ncbi:MAG TPA: UDP-2,3-diacylglucosamine diphosphatase [Arcobacter sp.]|nr:UDP-2,3-diacylglucosamine diphosphatase [Arcobacter sp.]
MLLNLKKDAIFIADSHYNHQRIDFENIMNDILSNKIETSQLFLMGDMFDFLCDEVSYFKKINQNVISKINQISQNIEVIYLEGNHDFNLKEIFPDIVLIKRENQPFIIEYNDEYIALSHGDIFTAFSYNVFTSIMRNKYFLKFLNMIDISSFISKYFENKLVKKEICHDIDNFQLFAKNRIKLYQQYDAISYIIEGHFHQGKRYLNYINIPSLACDNFYTKVKIENFKIGFENIKYN